MHTSHYYIKEPQKKLRLFLSLFCVLSLLCFLLPGAASAEGEDKHWPAAPSVSSEGAILIEATTGTVLYEKNSEKQFYPASTTKLMTALLAFENSAMGEVVTVSHDAVYNIPTDSSRIWVDEGEQLTMEESLYALMLPSANDLAYAISEHISETMPAFAELMNKRASELGCVNSHFVNPHGYDEEGHYSCPADLVRIMRELVKYPTFLKISGSKNHKIPATNLCKEDRWVLNTHLMIRGTNPYEGVIAGKTGHTDLAGGNLVTVAKRGNFTLIAAVMKSANDTELYADTAALLDYGFANFNTYTMEDELLASDFTIPPLFTKEDAVQTISGAQIISVESGLIVLPSTSSLSDVSKSITLKQLKSFQKGKNRVGQINYTYGSHLVGSADLVYYNENEAFTVPESSLTNKDNSSGNITNAPGSTGSSTKDPDQQGSGFSSDAGQQGSAFSGDAGQQGSAFSGDADQQGSDLTTDGSGNSAASAKKDRRPLIIGIAVGFICFLIGIYLVFIEIPYRKKRKDYLNRKRSRRR